jgi:hypothetical protein
MKRTWYVVFAVPKTAKRRGRRVTETFENESQAREFARQKTAEGLLVNAGTLNPHLPKRAIASSDIRQWIEEVRKRPMSNSMRRARTTLPVVPANAGTHTHRGRS